MKASAEGELELLRRPTGLGNEVYEALYGQLMSLKIAPGSRISVDKLSRSLGVSQTPIREALSRLEAQGLVVKTHLVGYHAAEQLDRDRLNQLYDLRLLLEPYAAASLARRRDDNVISDLKALDAEMRSSDKGSSRAAYGEFAKSDAAFHDFIARNCGNALVHDSLHRLHTHVHLFRLYFHARATTDANQEHEDLIAAIEDGDAARAEAAMRHHILCSKARFEDAFLS
jgi:DNA-binding GntR family transcriptional regulator